MSTERSASEVQNAPSDVAEEEPSARVSEHIDQNLRRAFEEDMDQDLPDRFKDLLDQLRQTEPGSDDGGSTE